MIHFSIIKAVAQELERVTPRTVWIRKAKPVREGESELGKEDEKKEDQESVSGGGVKGYFLAPAVVLSGWMVTAPMSITPSQWSYRITIYDIYTQIYFCVYIFPKY